MWMTLLKELLTSGVFLKKGGAIIIALLILLVGVDYKTQEAKTAYALAVLEMQFRSLDSEQQIIDMVNVWKKDSWGAQLGALRVVCETDPLLLDKFGTRSYALCRLVK